MEFNEVSEANTSRRALFPQFAVSRLGEEESERNHDARIINFDGIPSPTRNPKPTPSMEKRRTAE